jgi:ribonuclease BN (tRNA processing enzyme)
VTKNSHDEVKVTVLGCTGSSFDEVLRDPCSSYLVETSSAAILLDCGFGSFESYLAHAPDALIDAIFVSHAHADHVADLEAFMDSAKVWRDQPRLLASPETMALIAPNEDSLPDGTLVSVSERTRLEVSTFEAEFSRTTHKMPTLAVCVRFDNHRVVYCADTGPTWVVPPPFVGADLAIVECTLEVRNESDSLFHLDAQEAGILALKLSSHKTLITHIPPHGNGEARLAIAQGIASKEVVLLATPGLQLVVK